MSENLYQQAFSFLLPLRLYQPELDLRRLTRINLRSIEQFFDRSLLRKIVIATRPEDLAAIRTAVANSGLSLPVEVIPEAAVVPSLARLGGKGWFRQQVLKIFSWRVIDSPYVILLDDDVLMTRPTGANELLLGDRLVMSHLHADGFRTYLDSSCPLLDYDREMIRPEQRVMNVTPEIMVTSELQALVREIMKTWGLRTEEQAAEFLMKVSGDYYPAAPRTGVEKIWRRLRAKFLGGSERVWAQRRSRFRDWSEYTLYWIHLLKSGRTNLYYDYNAAPHARQLNDQGVWFEDQAVALGIDGWINRTFHAGHQHCFAVYSAKIEGVDRQELYDRIESHLCQ
jgi:hypothetical protein